MNHKAQGTIEYLVIIAIVVVIALVVVGLLLQILGNFSGSNETASKISWQSAEPWAIVDWSANDNGITFVLKNNTSDTLDFNSMHIQGDTNDTSKPNIAPGATIQVGFTKDWEKCNPGSKYAISKNDLNIVYDSTITGKVQYGVADIVGTC